MHKWNPPPYGLYKVNFDGAWNKESTRTEIGVIIKDCEGEILKGHAANTMRFADSFMVEAKAAMCFGVRI